jgi:hypothetical protein
MILTAAAISPRLSGSSGCATLEEDREGLAERLAAGGWA